MELHNIPPDVARLIFTLLPLSSLADLCATFDKRLLRLLSSRGLFENLHWQEPITSKNRLLLHTIRNVTTLRLHKGLILVEKDAMALLGLNPRTLQLEDRVFHKDLMKDRKAKVIPNADGTVLQNPPIYFTPLGLPNFALLTPRLEKLIITSRIEDIAAHSKGGRHSLFTINFPINEAILIPASLTHVRFDVCSKPLFQHLAQLLPLTLQSISMNARACNAVRLDDSFARFTALQDLCIEQTVIDTADFILPQSIKSLNLATLRPFPFEWLKRPETKNCALTKLDLAILHAPTDNEMHRIDLDASLPSTLLSLNMWHHDRANKSFPPVFISTLPRSLTELTLIHLRHLSFSTLSHLHNLEYLKVHSSLADVQIVRNGIESEVEKEDSLIVGINWLPRRLKALSLEFPSIDLPDDALTDLPLTLTTLRLTRCSLPTALMLKMLRPKCSIHILAAIEAHAHPNTQHIINEFRHLLEPTFDWWPFHCAVKEHYESLDIFFTLHLSALLHMAPANDFITTLRLTPPAHLCSLTPHRLRIANAASLRHALPNLTSLNAKSGAVFDILTLSFFPPNLTYLKLGSQPLYCEDSWSIPSLTFLSSRGAFFPTTANLKFANFPSLVHLNAPFWSWSPAHLQGRTFSRLRTQIRGILDTGVVEFLSSTFNTATYPNVRIGITCFDTGLLCPEFEPFNSVSERPSSYLQRRAYCTGPKLRTLLARTPLPTEASATSTPLTDDEQSKSLLSLVKGLSVHPADSLPRPSTN